MTDAMYERGILHAGMTYSYAGELGNVNLGPFFSAWTDVGYSDPVCIEVEDRAYEDSLKSRKRALQQSGRYLEVITRWCIVRLVEITKNLCVGKSDYFGYDWIVRSSIPNT